MGMPPRRSPTRSNAMARAGLEPACGFASTIVGNDLTLDDQSPKMARRRVGQDHDAPPQPQICRDEIAALHAAGCRYLQMTTPTCHFLATRNSDLPQTWRAVATERSMSNDEWSLKGRPADVTVCRHICRGNQASPCARAAKHRFRFRIDCLVDGGSAAPESTLAICTRTGRLGIQRVRFGHGFKARNSSTAKPPVRSVWLERSNRGRAGGGKLRY